MVIKPLPDLKSGVGTMVQIHSSLIGVVWMLLLLLLPITSLPLLAKWVGGSTVNPASALPLLILVIVWFIPYLIRRGSLALDVSPLIGFFAVAIVSSTLSYFFIIYPFKGQTIFSRESRALLTFCTGVAFYLVTSCIVQSKKALNRTLKLINVGGIIIMAWALAQAVVILFLDGKYPDFMRIIHSWFSIREMSSTRINGLTYEPSWLAYQLNLLYIPIWLSILVYRRTIYKSRLLGIPWEGLMLIAGIVAIFLAQSRIGLLDFLVLIGFLAIRLAVTLSFRLHEQVQKITFPRFSAVGKWVGPLSIVLLWILVLLLFLVLTSSAIYLASQLDWRLENLFERDFLHNVVTNPQDIFRYRFSRALKFAERTAYWTAGFRVFAEHPFLGVGLGNSGFFFTDTLPAYGWRAPEVVQVMTPATTIFPNPKNLWVRLLAETGIVGFTFFVVWLLVMLVRSLELATRDDHLYKALGLAGQLGLIAMVIEGFSVDTFGLPYFWILLGLISATARFSSSDLEPIAS